MDNTHNKSKIVNSLFMKLLPIQVLIIAVGSVNSIVDGVVAGQFIDSSTVGVIGLYFSMVNILNAVGSVLLGGTSVLCGRYMGEGDLKKTNGIFSLNITVALLLGIAVTALNILFASPLATILGATPELKPKLIQYTLGYAIGIIPFWLGQQVAFFLQLERQSARTYMGIGVMLVSNIAANIVFVVIFKMGVLGLALATSASNWIYFLFLAQFYLTDKAQLKYDKKNILWGSLKELIIIGFPGALLIFCLSIRNIIINRMLLSYGGEDALSAMAAFNMVSGLLIAYCLGNGNVVRMLVSIFFGEENKAAIRQVIRIVFTQGLALTLALTIIIIFLAGPITSIFFPDKSSNVYGLMKQLLIIYTLSLPLILVCSVNSNYLQAMGHNKFVNVQSVFDGFLSTVAVSAILAPILGIFGIWLAHFIGIAVTAALATIYCMIYWKHFPKKVEEALFFPEGFGVAPEDSLEFRIEKLEDVTSTSERVQAFCKAHGTSEHLSYYASLCLEEMAANVVEHGFTKDNKDHSVDVQVVYHDDGILLRIKDDCIPFNPTERAKQVGGDADDPMANIGIKLVQKLATSVTYQNLMKLNVLTIQLANE